MSRPISIANPVDIIVTPAKQITFWTTGANPNEQLTGDFRMSIGHPHSIAFRCASEFSISFSDFDEANPAPPLPPNRPTGQRAREFTPAKCPVTSAPPSGGPVFPSTVAAPYTLTLSVKAGTQFLGVHKYSVVVKHSDGSLVTIDPQIIVDH